MKSRLLGIVGLGIAAVTIGAFAPAVPEGGVVPGLGTGQAEAAVSKSGGGGGGGGNVNGAGGRLGDLLSQNGVPVLIAFAGVLLIGTLASRNIGASLGIVLITLVGLIFLLAPQSIADFAKGIANVVF